MLLGQFAPRKTARTPFPPTLTRGSWRNNKIYRKSWGNNKRNGDIDFAIDTPPQCLTIRLNSSNFYEGDDLVKTELDEQLKGIRNCYHQKYLNTKPNINNINESNCLKQKCKLIIEKKNGNIEI